MGGGAPRSITPFRGSTSIAMMRPPSRMYSLLSAGVPVRSPDGKTVSDPHSATGVLMAPTSDLRNVAAAGKAIDKQMNEVLSYDDGSGLSGLAALSYLAGALKEDLCQNGDFDYQRATLAKGTLQQLPQFRDVSNFNVGLLVQQAGLSLNEILTIAGSYARYNSSNYRPDQPYGLDPQTRDLTELATKLERAEFMAIKKATKAVLIGGVGIVAVSAVGYLVLRLVGIITPDACISEEMKTMADLSDAKVEIVYTNCDTLVKDEAVSVYFSRAAVKEESWFAKWSNHRSLVFRYDSGRPSGPPAIESPGKDRILISIPEVSSVFLRCQKWRNVSIDYNIGHIDYP
jgi:hypothetical protein